MSSEPSLEFTGFPKIVQKTFVLYDLEIITFLATSANLKVCLQEILQKTLRVNQIFSKSDRQHINN